MSKYLISEARGGKSFSDPAAGKSCFVFVFAFALRAMRAMRACVRASGGGGARVVGVAKVIIPGAGPQRRVGNTISLPIPGRETGDPARAQAPLGDS